MGDGAFWNWIVMEEDGKQQQTSKSQRFSTGQQAGHSPLAIYGGSPGVQLPGTTKQGVVMHLAGHNIQLVACILLGGSQIEQVTGPDWVIGNYTETRSVCSLTYSSGCKQHELEVGACSR